MPSLMDLLGGGLSGSDIIMVAAGLGGATLWANWYRKGQDTDKYLRIDEVNKRIRLGAFASIFIALLAGTSLGLYLYKGGWDVESASVLAFGSGIGGAWIAKVLLNFWYPAVCQIAQSKWFRDNLAFVPTPQALRPAPGAQNEVIHYIPAPSAGVQRKSTVATSEQWQQSRGELTEHLVALHQQGRISKDELSYMHGLIPPAPHLEQMERDNYALARQQIQLRIGEKADLSQLVYSQQHQLGKAIHIIDLQQKKMEDAGIGLQPTSRIPKEVIYAGVGAIARHIVGWILGWGG